MSVEVKFLDNFVIGNMLWNAGLLGTGAYLFKRWMDKQEEGTRENREERKQEIGKLNDNITRDFREVKTSIEKLTDHVEKQNGNVAKVTAEVHTQVALCKERNKDRPHTERCGDVQ